MCILYGIILIKYSQELLDYFENNKGYLATYKYKWFLLTWDG